MFVAATLAVLVAATPEEVSQKGCTQTFKALVGDINDKSFGRSIGGRVQALNAGLRDLGLQKRDAEAWAGDVAPLVAILRKNRPAFITFCKAELNRIFSPCEPYGFGTEPYGLCVRERLPEANCFADRGPWQFFASLKTGTLSESQTTLADFMINAANARTYCGGGR